SAGSHRCRDRRRRRWWAGRATLRGFPELTSTAGRIGKDDARESLVSDAKLSASGFQLPALRASSLQTGREPRDRAGVRPCKQGENPATERGFCDATWRGGDA